MEIHRRNRTLPQIVHLVFHKRNQRCDNNGHTSEHQRRYLKRYRLAAAGRKQTEGVVAAEHRQNYLLLLRTKGIISPVLPENIMNCRVLLRIHFEGLISFISSCTAPVAA